MRKGRLFIISGASGVGKSTVLKQVIARQPALQFSVSATTRPPRPGEQEGVTYYYVSRETFQGMIQRNEFVEHNDHMGNLYGTPKSQLDEKLEKGDVLLDIEPNGAFNVKSQCPEAVLIFIAPPSMAELEYRLRSRGDTPEDQIVMRLARANWEMQQTHRYNYVVVNDTVENCADQILKIIAQEAE